MQEHSPTDPAFRAHEGGKLAVSARAPLAGPADLALSYTPGVGRVSQAIADDPELVWRYTGRRNTVAVLTNGTAVLGLGDIGPQAALPVMEGKAVLFKQFAGIDAYPICVDARTVDELVAIGTALAPTFGGINLEDIAAPACFEVERRLQDAVDIPVFHDDQHGTAVVVLAAALNAARVVGKRLGEMTITVVGTGAAGAACARLLHHAGVGDIIGFDREGVLHRGLPGVEGLNEAKRWFVERTNLDDRTGGIEDAVKGSDLLLGLSGPGIVQPWMLEHMADDAIVFAMANPTPEIMPDEVPANVRVVATGRSDFPNQINNVLAFPGVFRGLLDSGAPRCTTEMKVAAAHALAALVPEPTPERILPSAFDPGVAEAVAEAIRREARAAAVAA